MSKGAAKVDDDEEMEEDVAQEADEHLETYRILLGPQGRRQ